MAAILSVLALICHFYAPTHVTRNAASLTFHTLHVSIAQSVTLHVHAGSNHSVAAVLLRVLLGRHIPPHVPASLTHAAPDTISLVFADTAALSVSHWTADGGGDMLHCYNVSWLSVSGDRGGGGGAGLGSLEDALQLGAAHWYGGAPQHKWPVEQVEQASQPYITGGGGGGVAARYWLSSHGVAVHVDWDVPLFLAINQQQDGLMRLTAEARAPYPAGQEVSLRYSLCHGVRGVDMRRVHEYAAATFLGRPHAAPDTRVFTDSLWSSRGAHRPLTQDSLEAWAHDIHQHGFSPAQLELDDDWTPHYGDLAFDESKFPDAAAMVARLQALGFRVTLATHPFASPLSGAFYSGSEYWVQHWLLALPAIIVWHDGLVAMLDVSNPQAVHWHLDRLAQLQRHYHIHSFKFADGEGSWLPTWHRTHAPLGSPNEYTRLHAAMAHRSHPHLPAQHILAASATQHLPLLTRLSEKSAVWGDGGLRSLIPHVLTLSVTGYAYVLPDVIGGNVLRGLPERELYVRWLQASTLLPAMHFSTPPWRYDAEVAGIARRMLALHRHYAPLMLRLAEEVPVTGAPIIRPLWWLCPRDPQCQASGSQYLVGAALLVAPVLEPGASSRHIYLPAGQWRDEVYGAIITGPRWLLHFPAPLHILPYFTRL